MDCHRTHRGGAVAAWLYDFIGVADRWAGAPGPSGSTFIRAYGAPFPPPADCRGRSNFPWTWRSDGYAIFREGIGGLPALREKPALMIEGMLDRAIPPALALADFAGLWPKAPVIQMPGAGHYIQEDAPEIVVPALQTFLAMLG